MFFFILINLFSFVSSSESFGINTDLFETNILNLSVVIVVVVYYGKIVLCDMFIIIKLNLFKYLI